MDSGDFVVLLFWGAIILLSIIQSAARQRKQQEEERRRAEAGDGLEPWAAEESAGAMLPEDLWEEISELARGERRDSTLTAPAEVPAEPSSERASAEEEAPVPRGEGAARGALAGAGEKALRRRARRLEEGRVGVPGGVTSRPAGGRASELFGGLSRPEIQRAVLLHEVLGPPVSKRGRGRGGR